MGRQREGTQGGMHGWMGWEVEGQRVCREGWLLAEQVVADHPSDQIQS